MPCLLSVWFPAGLSVWMASWLALAVPGERDLLRAAGPGPGGRDFAVDQGVELSPGPPRGALEEGLRESPLLGPLYEQALRALRGGEEREALRLVKQARALAFREVQSGRAPRRSCRHFVRLSHGEELLGEVVQLERQLSKGRERHSPDELLILQQERAILTHNKFLLLRSFTGRADERVLQQALTYYEAVMNKQAPGALPGQGQARSVLLVHYAALLGERGDRRGAQGVVGRLTPEEQQVEALDLPMAYYYLAQGDRRRSVSRLLQASRRESWDRPSSLREGRSLRSQVYRMNDFDDLRDDPLFADLVTRPEEAARCVE